MIDFDRLRNETQTLSDKIEESGERLARLRMRCDSDTQMLAHLREKEFMLGNLIIGVTEELQMYREDMIECRQIVNEKKRELGAVRRKYGISFDSSGLLEKPALLLDYDRVERKCDALTEEMDILKVKLKEVNNRTNELEKRLES